MKPAVLRSKSFLLWASLAPVCALAPGQATAQVFFYPFAYTFQRPIIEPEPDVSPRRIAAILAREGFRLLGPLAHRGDQIVATGVDAKGRRSRFLIDPYEGEVLSAWRLRPGFAPEGPPDGMARAEPSGPDGADAIEPEPRGPTVIPGIGGEGSDADIPPPSRPRPAARPRAKAAARSGADPHRATGHVAPAPETKIAPAPAASTIPPAPKTGAQPSVPAQATTTPPPAAAPEAAAPAAVPAPSPEQEKSPNADKDTGSQSSVGG